MEHIIKYISLVVVLALAVLLYCYKVTLYEYIRDLATILLITIGINLAYRRLIKFDEQLDKQKTQLKYQGDQIKIQREGDAAQRFRQGVELLANDREAVRTGAVHTLDELAKEHEKEYLEKIGRIFTLHLKEQGERQKGKPISEDMQAILHVFFKRGKEGYEKYSVKDNFVRFGLKNVNLQAANLEEAYMQGICLHGFNLSHANLKGAHLQGADLRESTNLQDADLQGVQLQRANLHGVQLHGEKLDLRGAVLDGAILKDINFDHSLLSSHPLHVILRHGRRVGLSDDTQHKEIFQHGEYSYKDDDVLKECIGHANHLNNNYEKLEEIKKKVKAKIKPNKSKAWLRPMSVKGATIIDSNFFDTLGVEDVEWGKAKDPEKLSKNNKWPQHSQHNTVYFHPLNGWGNPS